MNPVLKVGLEMKMVNVRSSSCILDPLMRNEEKNIINADMSMSNTQIFKKVFKRISV